MDFNKYFDGRIIKGIKSVFFLVFFWMLLPIAVLKDFRIELITISFIHFVILSIAMVISARKMVLGKNRLAEVMIIISLFPFGFSLVEVGISMLVLYIGFHWVWVSVVLALFWGLWLLPIYFKKVSDSIFNALMNPSKTKGKWVLGLLVFGGGITFPVIGALLRTFVFPDVNYRLSPGLFLITNGFIFQFIFIPQIWDQRETLRGNTR